jgi:hypothetical protein
MMSIARTVKAAFGIFVLIALHIIFFAMVGMILFAGSAEGIAYYDTMQTSLWNMVILLTTTNFPDMMLPAYCNNRLYALYFVIFYLLGLFFLYKLVLATFYNNYRLLIEKQAERFVREQQSYVYPTFLQLDPGDEGFISKDRFSELVQLLKVNMGFDEGSEQAIAEYLSYKQTFVPSDFSDISRIMNYKRLNIHPLPSLARASLPLNSYRRYLVKFLENSFSITFVQVVNLSNLVLQVMEEPLTYYYADYWLYVQVFYLSFYWLEMTANTLAYGFKAYFTSLKGIFDLTIYSVCLTFFILMIFHNDFAETNIFVIFGVTRLLNLARIFARIDETKLVIKTFVSLVPSFSNLLGVLVVVYYVFSMLGITLFGGLVYAENSSIFDDTVIPPNYIYNNFNDFPSSCVVLFELLVVNNWWVIARVFSNATNNYALWFFLAFYLIAPFIVLNILISFVIEMFNSQANLKKTQPKSEQPHRPVRLRKHYETRTPERTIKPNSFSVSHRAARPSRRKMSI